MDKTTIYECLGFVLGFLGIGIAYYAIHLGIRLERTKRELEHKERMRALELGRKMPGEGPWLSPLKAGVLVAAVVPIGVSAMAYLSSLAVGFQDGIWQVAGIVSCFAVVCGTVLTGHAFSRQSESLFTNQVPVHKEPVEEDLYDVVSARQN